MSNFCLWKTACGCLFFVSWCPPLHLCYAWLSCWFLQWLCILRFYVGIFLVGVMCLNPTIALMVGLCGTVDWFEFLWWFLIIWDMLVVPFMMTLILFLLKILDRGLWLEKCLVIRFRKSSSTFVLRLYCKAG